MKTITTTAIVALMTATLGLTAIAPTYAQEAAPAPAQQQVQDKGPGPNFRQHNQGPRQGRGFGDLLGFERGAEAVEIALVRLSHAVELTAEQQPLFDTFKTDALAAAETFSAAVEGLRPTPPAEGQTAERPDFTERLENRITFETAHLAALEAVQPAATAFFDSLSDAQKANLMPQRPNHDGGPHGLHKGPGPMDAPGAPAAPEAPATNG